MGFGVRERDAPITIDRDHSIRQKSQEFSRFGAVGLERHCNHARTIRDDCGDVTLGLREATVRRSTPEARTYRLDLWRRF